MKKTLIIVISILSLLIQVKAQRLMSCKGAVPGSYNFWFYTPEQEHIPYAHKDTLKPLVVFLHGSSLCGNNLERVRRYGTIHALQKGLDLDAFVVAPQNSGGAWNPSKLIKIVDWATSNCPIDTNRIYVFGMSLGGYGAADFAAAYPDRIAATIAMCGGSSSRNISGLTKMPLWLIHGTADRAVRIGESEKILRTVGGKRIVFTRLPGGNHGTPARVFYMREAYDWLFAHNLQDKDRPVCRDYSVTMNSIRHAYDGLVASRGARIKTVQWHPSLFDSYTPEPSFTPISLEPDQTFRPKAPNPTYHKVRKGDNLGSIAARHHTTIDKLCRMNKIKRNSRLSIGQRIRVK